MKKPNITAYRDTLFASAQNSAKLIKIFDINQNPQIAGAIVRRILGQKPFYGGYVGTTDFNHPDPFLSRLGNVCYACLETSIYAPGGVTCGSMRLLPKQFNFFVYAGFDTQHYGKLFDRLNKSDAGRIAVEVSRMAKGFLKLAREFNFKIDVLDFTHTIKGCC